MITIIDYGMGNIGSIANMLKKIGKPATISADPEKILEAERLILPGVGAFDNGMENLESRGLIAALEEAVLKRKKPILGICLGMQLFTKRSEEGKRKGLGWVEAETVRFNFKPEQKLRTPHMGWNEISPSPAYDSALRNLSPNPRFYFVHSFHVVCRNEDEVLTKTHYGFDFVSALKKDNIVGFQFHPEKSHRYGMQILETFASGGLC